MKNSLFAILYNKYKPFYVPIGVIFVCILVFTTIGIPQIQDYLAEKKREEELSQKLATLTSNLTLLSQTSPQITQEQFTTAVLALPSEKDYVGVLNTIAYVSAIANIPVNDFSFEVGNVAVDKSAAVTSELPSLQVQLSLQTNEHGAEQFLQVISETVPLSEAKNVTVGKGATTVEVVFYYKPFTNMPIAYDMSLAPLTTKEAALLQTLSQWEEQKEMPEEQASLEEIASFSATPTPVL